jgi:hypothetical protein
MLRFRVSLAVVAAALLSWPLATHGQRPPSLSPDLHDVRSDRVRVIVQCWEMPESITATPMPAPW